MVIWAVLNKWAWPRWGSVHHVKITMFVIINKWWDIMYSSKFLCAAKSLYQVTNVPVSAEFVVPAIHLAVSWKVDGYLIHKVFWKHAKKYPKCVAADKEHKKFQTLVFWFVISSILVAGHSVLEEHPFSLFGVEVIGDDMWLCNVESVISQIKGYK